MSDSENGKQMIVLTVLPGGKRLATLRQVRGVENGSVVFEAGEDQRRGTLPKASCIPVKDGDERTGMGLGVQHLGLAGLGTSSAAGDAEDDPLHACQVFDVAADAPFYLVRGPDKETREALLDTLQEAVVDKRARFACTPPEYEIIGLPEERMGKLGWVRAERIEEAESLQDLRAALDLAAPSEDEDQ